MGKYVPYEYEVVSRISTGATTVVYPFVLSRSPSFMETGAVSQMLVLNVLRSSTAQQIIRAEGFQFEGGGVPPLDSELLRAIC